MWRVFDDDGHQRGQTSRPVIGTEILKNVTLKRTYIIIATIWVFFSVAALCYFIQTDILYWLVPTGLFRVNVTLQNSNKSNA